MSSIEGSKKSLNYESLFQQEIEKKGLPTNETELQNAMKKAVATAFKKSFPGIDAYGELDAQQKALKIRLENAWTKASHNVAAAKERTSSPSSIGSKQTAQLLSSMRDALWSESLSEPAGIAELISRQFSDLVEGDSALWRTKFLENYKPLPNEDSSSTSERAVIASMSEENQREYFESLLSTHGLTREEFSSLLHELGKEEATLPEQALLLHRGMPTAETEQLIETYRGYTDEEKSLIAKGFAEPAKIGELPKTPAGKKAIWFLRSVANLQTETPRALRPWQNQCLFAAGVCPAWEVRLIEESYPLEGDISAGIQEGAIPINRDELPAIKELGSKLLEATSEEEEELQAKYDAAVQRGVAKELLRRDSAGALQKLDRYVGESIEQMTLSATAIAVGIEPGKVSSLGEFSRQLSLLSSEEKSEIVQLLSAPISEEKLSSRGARNFLSLYEAASNSLKELSPAELASLFENADRLIAEEVKLRMLLADRIRDRASTLGVESTSDTDVLRPAMEASPEGSRAFRFSQLCDQLRERGQEKALASLLQDTAARNADSLATFVACPSVKEAYRLLEIPENREPFTPEQLLINLPTSSLRKVAQALPVAGRSLPPEENPPKGIEAFHRFWGGMDKGRQNGLRALAKKLQAKGGPDDLKGLKIACDDFLQLVSIVQGGEITYRDKAKGGAITIREELQNLLPRDLAAVVVMAATPSLVEKIVSPRREEACTAAAGRFGPELEKTRAAKLETLWQSGAPSKNYPRCDAPMLVEVDGKRAEFSDGIMEDTELSRFLLFSGKNLSPEQLQTIALFPTETMEGLDTLTDEEMEKATGMGSWSNSSEVEGIYIQCDSKKQTLLCTYQIASSDRGISSRKEEAFEWRIVEINVSQRSDKTWHYEVRNTTLEESDTAAGIRAQRLIDFIPAAPE